MSAPIRPGGGEIGVSSGSAAGLWAMRSQGARTAPSTAPRRATAQGETRGDCPSRRAKRPRGVPAKSSRELTSAGGEREDSERQHQGENARFEGTALPPRRAPLALHEGD